MAHNGLVTTALAASVLGLVLSWLAVPACPGPAAFLPAVRPPAPLARADLPRDRWQRHDLSMLQGCWRRITDMEIKNLATGAVTGVASWTFCFEPNGHGEERILYQSGGGCSARATASFLADDTLVIGTEECFGTGIGIVPESFPCRWRDPGAANCPGFLAGRRPVPFWAGGFHPGLFMR